MSSFLLEIRTEELPANALPGARRQLSKLFGSALADAGFVGCEVAVYSTSRRLAVVIQSLPERQPDRTEELTGPPIHVAFAEDGSPNPAALGFSRKVGLPIDEIARITTDKGEYLAATVTHRGRPTSAILAEIVPSVMEALRFPKMMRWGLGEYVFGRPVHGAVALLDDEVVPLSVFGVAAGRSTVGHRVHDPKTVDFATAKGYAEKLEAHAVEVDPERRRALLESRATELAAEVGGRIHHDPDLMAEHVELVEYPGLLCGGFDSRYLELPPEVVISTLRHHQKCLIIEDDGGNLQPHFVAVIDRRDDPEGLVRQGNEWVIGARLADAGFFFAEDRKVTFDSLAERLDRVEWHRVLGSMAAKADRVGELAVWLAQELAVGCDEQLLRRVATLVKTDLLTHMVGEFPELQGIMGGHYLRLGGECEAVWGAARDHYQPVGFDGRLPVSIEGLLIGAADRLDTVASLFAVGEKPTGSKDPFGLRRAAQGLVRIIVDAGWEVDLLSAVKRAVDPPAKVAGEPAVAIAEAVAAYIGDRVRRYMVDRIGVAGDTADAVMAAGWSNLPSAIARAQALDRVREEESFRSLALAFKRVRNITEGQPEAEVVADRFETAAERELFAATLGFRKTLGRVLPERRVDEAFAAMEPLADVLERFFIEVLVMCEDDVLRQNRIAMLQELGREFIQLADLSRLQVEGGDE